MPIVNAKCTNCGANLTVDEVKDAAICQYCGSAFIVEKAINNYNVVNNIKADVVNVYGATNDFDIRGGVLIKYSGLSLNPVIPEGVIKVGEWAFSKTMIISIFIPNSVTEISEGAFYGCSNLNKVIISKKLKIVERDAFNGCNKMLKITLPKTIEQVWGESVPYGDDDYSRFVIPDSSPYAIKKRELKEKMRLEEESRVKKWKNSLHCQHCGGEFKGMFKKTCSKCGKPKDY